MEIVDEFIDKINDGKIVHLYGKVDGRKDFDLELVDYNSVTEEFTFNNYALYMVNEPMTKSYLCSVIMDKRFDIKVEYK